MIPHPPIIAVDEAAFVASCLSDKPILKELCWPEEAGMCPVCGEHSDSLEIHVILHHLKAKTNCDYPVLPVCWCGKRFSSSVQCYDHLREEGVWAHFATCGLGVDG